MSLYLLSSGCSWGRANEGTPWGTHIWFRQGCATRASKPLPFLRVSLVEKGIPIFRDFLSRKGPFFTKMDPCLEIIFKNGTHVQGFFMKKQPIRVNRVKHPDIPCYVRPQVSSTFSALKETVAGSRSTNFTSCSQEWWRSKYLHLMPPLAEGAQIKFSGMISALKTNNNFRR